jgi:flagellar biogenesis protein FliO
MEVARQLLSVLLVFALLGLAVWALRRKSGALPLRIGNPGKNRKLEPAERLALTPQHALHLVRVNGRELLVATHPQGCSVLADGPEATKGAGA